MTHENDTRKRHAAHSCLSRAFDSTFYMENTMTTSRQPSKDTSAEAEDKLLDEALDETFPASDPVAVKPDESEADHLKTQQPRSASGSGGAPTSQQRR
jgi:hypothetical protein